MLERNQKDRGKAFFDVGAGLSVEGSIQETDSILHFPLHAAIEGALPKQPAVLLVLFVTFHISLT